MAKPSPVSVSGDLFGDGCAGLRGWSPAEWPVAPDWRPCVDAFLQSDEGKRLARFLAERLAGGALVFPPHPLRALELTPRSQVRVVILGQDPYHGPGQAEGLAFSVPPGVRMPPSLRNIFKEIQREYGPSPNPGASGSLVGWASQGVLLLNSSLTVESGQAGSHAGKGWEGLSDAVIDALAQDARPKVFVLWGAHAQAKQDRIKQPGHGHLVLTSNHPSPLSATRGPSPFIGCGHFSQANRFLAHHGQPPVQWLPKA